jgi:hypothetical protein
MMLGAWMMCVIRLFRKTLLISFMMFTVAIAGHIHFWPVGKSLFVSAWFIFLDSIPALILGVILDFAVESVFAILVCVTFGTGVKTSTALRCPRVLILLSVLVSGVSPVLESSNLVFVVLGFGVAVFVDGCHRLGGLCSTFPLGVSRNLVHVNQCDCILIVLSNDFSQISQ